MERYVIYIFFSKKGDILDVIQKKESGGWGLFFLALRYNKQGRGCITISKKGYNNDNNYLAGDLRTDH